MLVACGSPARVAPRPGPGEKSARVHPANRCPYVLLHPLEMAFSLLVSSGVLVMTQQLASSLSRNMRIADGTDQLSHKQATGAGVMHNRIAQKHLEELAIHGSSWFRWVRQDPYQRWRVSRFRNF